METLYIVTERSLEAVLRLAHMTFAVCIGGFATVDGGLE
jgi:hypothetical protein